MQALSVQQPWAELISSGRKTIELRSWSTGHRGDLLICAGQRFDVRGSHHRVDGPGGVARAVVDLYEIRPATIDDAEAGGVTAEQMHGELLRCAAKGQTLYAWLLRDVRAVEPVRISGKLGLFSAQI